MGLQTTRVWKCFGGEQHVFSHASNVLDTCMEFSVFLPPAAAEGPVPAVLYLSGLTCTWENATTKAGFQRVAAELGLAVVCPDTSPRGPAVPDDASDSLGQGAGFYLDATQEPWAHHYRMQSYVTGELLDLLGWHLPLQTERLGIMGHSMGGHGALVLGLRHPTRFASISAFAPIVNPTEVPWGIRAFTAYLGADPAAWSDYDACRCVERAPHPSTILIDQGTRDPFLGEQLVPDRFAEAAAASGQRCDLRMRDGYDHSYYFIATFIEEHLRHHARALGVSTGP